jgi:hypothetical protein
VNRTVLSRARRRLINRSGFRPFVPVDVSWKGIGNCYVSPLCRIPNGSGMYSYATGRRNRRWHWNLICAFAHLRKRAQERTCSLLRKCAKLGACRFSACEIHSSSFDAASLPSPECLHQTRNLTSQKLDILITLNFMVFVYRYE